MFCSRCGAEVDAGAKFCPTCGLDLASTTPIAAVVQREDATETDLVRDALANEYEIVDELGRGGMAIVFKAKEKALDRDVAVKVLPLTLAFDQEFVERFQREARTAAKLEHPHIIPIYRVGKAGRVIYFVMKFLRGKSLSDLIEQRGALPPAEIRKLLIQTTGALGYAHRYGIVHRDIKPDNIMFDESGHAIVTDFGIAKAASGTRLTGTGMSIGTPHYMSPEQARAHPLDGRSDIYSLGVVAYQCLTSHVPFDGEDSFSIGYKHIMEEIPVPPLKSVEQRELFALITKMMAKAPDERFQSAEELQAVLEGRAPVATPPNVADAPTTRMASAGPTSRSKTPTTTTTPTTPVPRTEPRRAAITEPPKKRSGVLMGMVTLLVVGGGGVGGYWYFVEGPGAVLVDQWREPGTAAAVTDSSTLARSDSATADSIAALAVTDSVERPSVTDLPNNGWIALRGAVPRTAMVRVDGETKATPFFSVPVGSRKVEVSARGFETFTHNAVVARGDTVVVTVTMKPLEVADRPSDGAGPPSEYCAQPGPEYNRDGSCFDVAPGTTEAPLVDVPAGVTGTPSPVQLWVLVGVDGRPKNIARAQDSDEFAFTRAVLSYARDLQFIPARKDGRPTEAWLRLLVRPRR